MGCSSSKDAVQTIEIQEGEVKKKSKKVKVVSSDESMVNELNATVIGTKSMSAKSRDSGIGGMEYDKNLLTDGVITEESDPHLVEDVESQLRPATPGRRFENKNTGRVRSKAILEELEAEGLISGSKVQRGGAAFDVSLGPRMHLEPLAPIRRPPPRLERLKSEKKLPSKQELEEKMKLADIRRKENLEKKSRLASQLAHDQALAGKLGTADGHEFDPADNADVIVKPTKRQADYGQGENVNKTIFDQQSLSSDEGTKTDLTDSTDAFFKENGPRTDTFSQSRINV